MAASRPLVTVQGLDGTASGQTALPAVFTAPIRPDVVLQVGRLEFFFDNVESGSGGWILSACLSVGLFFLFLSVYSLCRTHVVSFSEDPGVRSSQLRFSEADERGSELVIDAAAEARSNDDLRRLRNHRRQRSRRRQGFVSLGDHSMICSRALMIALGH